VESGEGLAQIHEKGFQGVRGELLHQLGHERELKGSARRVDTFSVSIGGGSFLPYRERIGTLNLGSQYVELEIDFLVSVHPSIFKKNG
jgi:hypothetical protein